MRRVPVTLAAALLLVAAALAVPGGDAAADDSSWDPRLGDLPAKVARLRGLRFDHPVPVRFLTESAFLKRHAVDPGTLSAGARRELRRATRAFRALGLLEGEVDLGEAVTGARRSRVLAYYDEHREEVVVRGRRRRLDAPQRATLVHELTHVLQDQHFDLTRLRKKVKHAPGQSSDAFRAVVEGDAERIEEKYRSSWSASDRAEYRRWQRATSDRVEAASADIPAIVTLSMMAPYSFGRSAMKIVAAGRGNDGVDEVFRHGVFTQQLFVDPAASLTGAAPEPMPAPKPAAGERAVDSAEQIGAFDLYLLLASRTEPVAALDAATAWSNGRMRLVRDADRLCVRRALKGDGRAGTDRMASALSAWALAMPAGQAEVGRSGDVLNFRACDPGPAAVGSPDLALEHAAFVLALHSSFEEGIAEEARDAGLSFRAVRCLALELMKSPGLTVLLALPPDDVTSEQMSSAVEAAVPAVRESCGL